MTDSNGDPLERLEETASKLADRATYENGNRRGLLWVHAFMGCFAGPQMALWGSAVTIEHLVGVNSRYVLAVIGFSGGLLLTLGLTRRPRSVPLEAAGLVLMLLWDSCMAAGLAAARIKQNDYHVIGWGAPVPPGYVSGYPITIYAGLAGLVAVHLWTLRRFRKSGLKL